MTIRRNECANEMIVETNVMVSWLSVIALMNEWSIFSEWTGSFAK